MTLSTNDRASWIRGLALLVLVSAFLVSCGSGGGDDVTGPGPGPGPGTTMSDSVRWAAIETATQTYGALRGTPDRNAVMVSMLLATEGIAAAGVSDSAGNVWARFDDGRLLMLLDNRVMSAPPEAIHRNVESFRAALRERDALRAQAGPGLELPVSSQARMLNSMEPRWAHPITELTAILEATGYQVTTGGRTRLADLENVDGDGILYWMSHAGIGGDQDDNDVFGIWSESRADSVTDQFAFIKDYWTKGQICYLSAEVQQPNGTLVWEKHYGITQQFVRDYMSFSDNSVVYIDACTSNKDEIRLAFFAAKASVYCGWDALASNSSGIVARRFFDLLCGTNQAEPQNPRQRPFLFEWVRRWMISNGRNMDPVNVNTALHMTVNPTSPHFGLLAPTINRMYVHDTPDVVDDYLEIEGDFGLDPGAANRAVTIGGVALPVDQWSEHLITLPLPRNGMTSFGDVTVKSRGHLSNAAHLTRWVVPFTYERFGPQSLKQIGRAHV